MTVRYSLILLFVAVMGGCAPYSTHPLTDAGKEEIDPSLFGAWFWRDADESGYMHIGLYENDKRLLHLLMASVDESGDLEVIEFVGHPSSIRKKKYVNLKLVRPSDEADGYWIFKHTVDGDSLQISFWDSKVVEKAIRSNVLKGTIEEGEWIPLVQVTEGQRKLRRFVSKYDETLFKEKTSLDRLRPSGPDWRREEPCGPDAMDACLKSHGCTVELIKDQAGKYLCRASKSPCEKGFRQSVHGRGDCEAIGDCRFVPGECFCPPVALCACGGGAPPQCLPISP